MGLCSGPAGALVPGGLSGRPGCMTGLPCMTWVRARRCWSCPIPRAWSRAPEAHSPLVKLLAALGRRVVTFDPPGAFASPRPPRLGLA